MLAIRLARIGAKKQAAYRVVVMEKSRARNSRSVEILGHYNPRRNPTEIELKQERVEYWLSQGAQPSDRVSRLLKVYQDRPADFAATEAAKSAEAKQERKKSAATAESKPEAAEQPAAEGNSAEAPAAGAVEKGSAEATPAQDSAPGDEPKSSS